MIRKTRIVTLGLAAAIAATALVALAGDLNPPAGPVAPTMKPLTEVEPRIAINATNTPGDADSLFRITQPGSYYLTGNVTGVVGEHGIEIAADNVSIDLNGFALIGSLVTLSGVNVPAIQSNLVVLNGAIRGWGGDGVSAGNANNSQLRDLRVSHNTGKGLFVGGTNSSVSGNRITGCTAAANGDDGIAAGLASVVMNCTAHLNALAGFDVGGGATVTGCSADDNELDGIFAGVGCTVSHCTARSNGRDGFQLSTGGTVSGCTSVSNTGDGIQVTSDCHVLGNTCDNNGSSGDGAGIHAIAEGNRIDGNNVTDNDRGVDCNPATGNLIVRNSAGGNTTNYDIAAGNADAQVLSPGAGFVSTDPWANFAF